MGGVYEGRREIWKDHSGDFELWYKNNNGLADGRRMVFESNVAYAVCYNSKDGLTLHSGNMSPRPDLIGVLFFKKLNPGDHDDRRDPGHYIPLRRFRISGETRSGKLIVNDQVYFKQNSIVKLVDGSEELELSVQ